MDSPELISIKIPIEKNIDPLSLEFWELHSPFLVRFPLTKSIRREGENGQKERVTWGQFEYQFANQISIHLILKGQARINAGPLETMQLNLQLTRVRRLELPFASTNQCTLGCCQALKFKWKTITFKMMSPQPLSKPFKQCGSPPLPGANINQ